MMAVVWRLTPDRTAEWRNIRLQALRTARASYGSRLGDWRDSPLDDFAAHLADAPCFAAGAVVGRPLAVACWEADRDQPRRACFQSVYATPSARAAVYRRAVAAHHRAYA